MELDILERNVISAISKCSCFSFSVVERVYLEIKSFDKTIEVLKVVLSSGRTIKEVLDSLNDM